MHIPRFMCTQHPDSTVRISTAEEVDEAVISYLAYSCDEMMVDYEGKNTPYSQPRDIAAKAVSMGLPLGERFFVTVRIPNPKLEEFHRSMLALEAAVLTNTLSVKEVGSPAVRWIILPMTEDFGTMVFVYRALYLKHKALLELGAVRDSFRVDLVPLVEDALRQLEIGKFIKTLFRAVAQSGYVLDHMRIFLGISDSAVRHGHMASALALIKSLQQIEGINREGEYKVLPILGMGSPPFRGGINNPSLAQFEAEQYRGYRTVTIQSAVRYDVSYSEFQRVRDILGQSGSPNMCEISDEWIKMASGLYRETVWPHLDAVRRLASVMPNTRERVSWHQYGRKLHGEDPQLPRAIVYTAAWYFAGVPPALLDAPFVKLAYRKGFLDQVIKALPSLVHEWRYEAKYYSRKRAERILGAIPLLSEIEEAFDILGIKPEPDGVYEALLQKAKSTPHVVALSRIRGFLG